MPKTPEDQSAPDASPVDAVAAKVAALRTRRLVILGLIDEGERQSAQLAGTLSALRRQLTENRILIDGLADG